MKRDRKIRVKDTSKLEAMGFVWYEDPIKYISDCSRWHKYGIRIDKKGNLSIYQTNVPTLEAFAELAKADLLEFVPIEKGFNVRMSKKEYEEYMRFVAKEEKKDAKSDIDFD